MYLVAEILYITYWIVINILHAKKIGFWISKYSTKNFQLNYKEFTNNFYSLNEKLFSLFSSKPCSLQCESNENALLLIHRIFPSTVKIIAIKHNETFHLESERTTILKSASRRKSLFGIIIQLCRRPPIQWQQRQSQQWSFGIEPYRNAVCPRPLLNYWINHPVCFCTTTRSEFSFGSAATNSEN